MLCQLMEVYSNLIIQQINEYDENVEEIENDQNVENDENVENDQDVEHTLIAENTECFICFEIIRAQQFPQSLKNQKIFFKFCSCDGWIHDSCLKTWFNTNEVCPICRNIMVYNICCEFECGFYIIYYFYVVKTFLHKFLYIILRVINFCILYIIVTNILHILSVFCKEEYNYEKCKEMDYYIYYI